MFTVYRPTNDFLDSLTYNDDNLKLYRERSFEVYSGIHRMVSANQEMLDKGYLIPAATVQCSISDLFELTRLGSPTRLTSTSVGDVFEDADGQFYIVTCFDITSANLVKNK